MSGGAFEYIQLKDGEELLKDHSSMRLLETMVKQLSSYGPAGAMPAAQTQAFLVKLQAFRNTILAMEEEIGKDAEALYDVWRAADYEGANDIGRDDAIEVMQAQTDEAMSPENRVKACVKLALADAMDDETTPLEETGKRWQFCQVPSATPERQGQIDALLAAMTDREREDAKNKFHQELGKIRFFASGRPVDIDFLLSIF